MSWSDYRKPLRAINFICHAPQAKSVSLVGDFNQWNPSSHPMKQMTLDPKAQGVTRTDKGERVSLVPVS